MVEIADIVDRASLQEWLEGQPGRSSAIVAHRAAMRRLLDFLNWCTTRRVGSVANQHAINLIFRQNLIAGFAAYNSEKENKPKVKNAAENASSTYAMFSSGDQDFIDALSTLQSYNERAGNAYEAAHDAIAIACAENGVAKLMYGGRKISVPSLAATVAELESKMEDSFAAARSDAASLEDGKDLSRETLWPQSDRHLDTKWAEVKQTLVENDVDWSFWIKWYDSALNGEPLNWEMLERMALIDQEDWDLGPEHVNGLIAGIEAEFEGEVTEAQATPAQMLLRNRSTIDAQLDTLAKLVNDEMSRIRGKNDFNEAEGALIVARLSVLESIIEAVEKIKAALDGEAPSTALAVIDEQLPEVINRAEELHTQKPEDVLSPQIISLGIAVKFLTDNGMDGPGATKIAAADIYGNKAKRWIMGWCNKT